MTGGRERLTGRITVALPPGEAYRLFTPRGEQDWAHGWHPVFPVPAPDDAEPGTVFETRAHGQPTIWVVTSREPGRRICYARVTPGDLAGTVTVTISPSGDKASSDSRGRITPALHLAVITVTATTWSILVVRGTTSYHIDRRSPRRRPGAKDVVPSGAVTRARSAGLSGRARKRRGDRGQRGPCAVR